MHVWHQMKITTHRWVTKHVEALYKMSKGMPKGHYIDPTALSADKQTLFIYKRYTDWLTGVVYIPFPEKKLDSNMTVIALLLDGPLEIYRENVGAIESNQ